MKFLFLVTFEPPDWWRRRDAAGELLPEFFRMNLADAAQRFMPEDAPAVLVDQMDSPDHAYSVFLLRAGWRKPARSRLRLFLDNCRFEPLDMVFLIGLGFVVGLVVGIMLKIQAT